MNSRSARVAPASSASERPAPTAPRGFVVRLHSGPPRRCPAPLRGRGSRPSRSRRPAAAVVDRNASAEVRSCTSMRGCPATSSDRRAVRWRPVALRRHAPRAGGCDRPRATAATCRRRCDRTGCPAPPAHAPAPVLPRTGSGPQLGAGAAPGIQGVPDVKVDVIVRLDRRGQPALRPVTGRLGERRAGHEGDARPLSAATNAVKRPAAPAPTTAMSTGADAGRAGAGTGQYGIHTRGRAPLPGTHGPRLVPTSPFVARARHGRPSRAARPHHRDRTDAEAQVVNSACARSISRRPGRKHSNWPCVRGTSSRTASPTDCAAA